MADKTKRLVIGGMLLAALAAGLLGGMPSSSTSGNSAVPVAYADDCNGPLPPPDLDCPRPPTPTPTPDPEH